MTGQAAATNTRGAAGQTLGPVAGRHGS